MRTPIAASLFLLAAAATAVAQTRAPKQAPWQGYNQGLKWEASLDEAMKRAAKENKPVLLYQLVGDLNKEGC